MLTTQNAWASHAKPLCGSARRMFTLQSSVDQAGALHQDRQVWVGVLGQNVPDLSIGWMMAPHCP